MAFLLPARESGAERGSLSLPRSLSHLSPYTVDFSCFLCLPVPNCPPSAFTSSPPTGTSGSIFGWWAAGEWKPRVSQRSVCCRHVCLCVSVCACVGACLCVCVGAWLDNGCCLKRLLSPFTSLLLSLWPGDVRCFLFLNIVLHLTVYCCKWCVSVRLCVIVCVCVCVYQYVHLRFNLLCAKGSSTFIFPQR